ncbi:tyrosine-type recombinase/integrase [Primorskyibacter sp. S87]|uniref:tyrosine-type recombinase/integrase n=1 Tax=Primorskyibacter sp. S87 TaxID=3415126 RepID=UPI003C7D95AF
MASIGKLPSGSYRASINRSGVRKTKCFPTRREAQAWAASVEQKLLGQSSGIKVKPSGLDLKTLLDRYRSSFKDTRPAHEHINRSIIKHFGNPLVGSINEASVMAWCEKRLESVKAITLYPEARQIYFALRYAFEEHSLDVDYDCPNRCLNRLRRRGYSFTTARREDIPTGEDLDRMYEWFRATGIVMPMERIIRFACATGLRAGELVRVSVQDYDRDNRTLLVRDRKDPNKRHKNTDHVLPLTQPGIDVIEAMIADGCEGRMFPWCKYQISRHFKRAAIAVGRPELVLHSCRHLCATNLVAAGLPIFAVQAVTNHKDIRNLQRYSHVRPADVHDLMKKHGVN